MKQYCPLLLVLALAACNGGSSHSHEHMHTDSMHAMHDTATTAVSMKGLMDKMMTAMHAQKATGNTDIDYANMMLQHHQGAVNMAQLQLAQGSNEVLKEFSRKVIADQQKEIAVLGEYISKAKADLSPDAASFKNAMDSSMNTMMNAMPEQYNNIDKDFVAQMIPHHQSAVDMAKAYLRFGNAPVLKQLSESIITAQEKEISWLKEWLQKNG
ncbi:MAG: DUF305 domain-containing protein [Ferruginibacter sp.]